MPNIKTFFLRNFAGKYVKFTLENPHLVQRCILLSISGDEVLYAEYNKDNVIKFDSCENRSISFFDDLRIISVDDLRESEDENIFYFK